MSQVELARRMDRPLKTVNEIVKGKTAITADTALQLEVVLGIPARLWNNLQRDYWEAGAREDERQRRSRDEQWVDGFPVVAMAQRNWIPSAATRKEALDHVLRFFAVSGPSAWDKQWSSVQAAFRRSPIFAPSPHAVSAWLRRGEIMAAEIACGPFDSARLREALPAIRDMTRLDPIAFMPELTDVLATCGVALVMTPELPGTHLAGAARWLSTDKALVQLSLRHKTDDQFWFALFHELAHLLRSGPRSAFLDAALPSDPDDPAERAADRFAATQLVPDASISRIKEGGEYEANDIKASAAQFGVPAGILLGRLQRAGLVAQSRHNYLKRRWQWGDQGGNRGKRIR